MRLPCHFSSIFESLWQFWAVIAITLFRQAVISRMNQAKGAADEENLAEDIRPDMVPESIAEVVLWGIGNTLS